jgi:hypothetical protein
MQINLGQLQSVRQEIMINMPLVVSRFAERVDQIITEARTMDASDVNGEAVVHDLRSKGWLILPPK